MTARLGRALLSAIVLILLCTVAVGAAKTPPTAVKNLAAWYDASDSSNMTLVPNGVTTWNDKSGNNLNLASASGSKTLPFYKASAIGGLSDISFSGSSTYFSAAMSAAPGTNPPHTIFVVGKGTANAWGSFVSYSAASASNANSAVGPAAVNATSSAWWFGGYGQDSPYAGGTGDGAPHLFTKVFDGTTVSGDYDGSAVLSKSTTYNLTDNHIFVGQQVTNGNGPLSGEIGEIVIYNTALSTANYQYIEGYLACKWGLQSKLPSSHPYASTCPSGNPLTSGFSAPLAWYDASDSSTVTVVNLVSQVNDKSGNGNTLTQSTAAAQPYLLPGTSQALLFSGGQQLLSSASNTLATGSNPSSIFVVGAFNGTLNGSYAQVASYGTGNNNKMRGIGKNSGNALVQAQEYSADLTTTSSWSSSPLLAYAAYGTSTESISANGNPATSAAHTPNTSASTQLHVGSELAEIVNRFGAGMFNYLVDDRMVKRLRSSGNP